VVLNMLNNVGLPGALVMLVLLVLLVRALWRVGSKK